MKVFLPCLLFTAISTAHLLQLSLLPDVLVFNHPLYRQLKVQCDTAVKELLDTRVLMELLQREMLKILQSRRAELEQVEVSFLLLEIKTNLIYCIY